MNSSKTEQVIDAISGEVIDVTARVPKITTGDDLFREVQEEEKLDVWDLLAWSSRPLVLNSIPPQVITPAVNM